MEDPRGGKEEFVDLQAWEEKEATKAEGSKEEPKVKAREAGRAKADTRARVTTAGSWDTRGARPCVHTSSSRCRKTWP